MKWLNAVSKGAMTVLTGILLYLQVYLLAAVVTACLLGFAVLTVSIFATVPAILSNYFWVLFLIVSIILSVILGIYFIVKYHVQNKKMKAQADKIMKENEAKAEEKKE